MRFMFVLIVLSLCAVPVLVSETGGALAQSPGQTFEVVGVRGNDRLNVRARPSSRSAIVGRLSANTKGVQLQAGTRRNGRTIWVNVRHGRVSGWVNRRYLRRESTPVRGEPAARPRLATSANVDGQLGKRVALVVGNGAYKNGISVLANAPNDGRDVGAALSKLGFDVVQLVDSDLRSTKAALETFAKRAKGAEIALFYFAGHGIQVSGENYLLPTSAKLAQPEDLLVETLSLSDVMDAFAEAKPALSMVVLDACRNNPITDVLRADARARGLHSMKIGKGLAKRSGLPGMMIVYSTDPDNVASDGTGRNSPFTKALLEKVSEPEVEVRLMFGSVRDVVVKETEGEQTPWMEEAVLGRFFFIPPPKIRTSLFHGRWQAEHWTLLIDKQSVEMSRAFQSKAEVLAQSKCGNVYSRTYSTLKIDRVRQELGNPRIEKWARGLKGTKTLRVMKIVCAYGANLYYFLLGRDAQMLVARFSEQDWLMLESFDKDLR